MFKNALTTGLASLSTIYLSSCNAAFENILTQNTDSNNNQNLVVLFSSYDQGCREAISKLSQQLNPLDSSIKKKNDKEVCLSDIQLKFKEYQLYNNKNKSKIYKLEEDLYNAQNKKGHISKEEYLQSIKRFENKLSTEINNKLAEIGNNFSKINQAQEQNNLGVTPTSDYSNYEYDKLNGYKINLNDFNLLIDSSKLSFSPIKKKILKNAINKIYLNNGIETNNLTSRLPIAQVLKELNINLLRINKDLEKNKSNPAPENPWGKFNKDNDDYLNFRDIEYLNQNIIEGSSITTLIPMTEIDLIQVERDNTNSLSRVGSFPESILIDSHKHHDKLTMYVAHYNGTPFEKSISLTIDSMLQDESIKTNLNQRRDEFYKQYKSYNELIHFIQKYKNENKQPPLIISTSISNSHTTIYKENREPLIATVEEMLSIKNSKSSLKKKKDEVAKKLYLNPPFQFFKSKKIGDLIINGKNQFTELGGQSLTALGNNGAMQLNCIVNSSIPEKQPVKSNVKGSYECIGAINQRGDISNHIKETEGFAEKFNYETVIGVPDDLYDDFLETNLNKNIAAVIPLTSTKKSPLGKDPKRLSIGSKKNLKHLKTI